MNRTGFAPRLGALVLDLTILFAVVFALALPLHIDVALAVRGNHIAMGLLVLFGLIPIGYSSLEIWMAATPGKKMLGLRIMSMEGSPASLGQLIVRWAIKNVAFTLRLAAAVTGIASLDSLEGLCAVIVFFGCFLALGASHMALHDRIAKTAVFAV